LDKDGKTIRTFSTHPKGKGKDRPAQLDAKAGMNHFTWDLRYPKAEDFPGMVLWGGLPAPKAVPGTYQAKFTLGSGTKNVVPFKVLPDPRSAATVEEMQEQFEFVIAVRDKLTEIHQAIKQVREVREQMQTIIKRLDEKKHKDAIKSAQATIDKMTVAEEALHQTKAKSSQDVLNFPIRLNNKMAQLAGNVAVGDYRPTKQALEVKEDLFVAADVELSKLYELFKNDVPQFNQTLQKLEVPAVIVPSAP
jgi:hypothetical protein